MNVTAYIDALERSAKNLPGVLLEWSSFDEDLRVHYSDAMIELLSQHAQAQREVESATQRAHLTRAWADFMGGVVEHVWAIVDFMGFNPLELVAPPSIALDTFEPDAECSPVALAA